MDLPHRSFIDSIAAATATLMEHFNSGILDHREIATQSTAVIQYISSIYATLLTARATALGYQGKFKDALADTRKAIECAPTLEEGYLVQGQLYSLQGKQQGAIDTFERGLCYAHPSTWPVLYERREKAKQLLEKRIDFVALVPAEIVAIIFSTVNSVDEEQLLECTLVSKRWRRALQECTKLWTNATVRYNHYMNPTAQLLPMVAHNVQTLHMELVREQRVKLVHSLAEKNLLRSVSTLVLMFQTNDIATTKQYLSLITCFQGSLKDLTIAAYSEPSGQRDLTLALHSILATCSNLKRLFISSTTTKFLYNSSNTMLTPPNTYKLTALEVQVPDTASLLEVLIPQCPNLRFLSMACREPKVLKLVDQYCLNLKHLKVCNDPCDDEAANEYEDDLSIGLRSIYYGNSRASRNTGVEHRFMQFFVNSQESLENLTLNYRAFGINAKIQHQWFFLSHLRFANLKSLQIHCQVEVVDLWKIISTIMQKCSLLDAVSFEMPGLISCDFFVSLVPLPLRTLDLYSFNDRTCDSLIKLFQHHSALGPQSTLRSITISHCNAVTERVLNTLADICTLRTLKLAGPLDSFAADQTRAFLHKLTGIPKLANILLERIYHVELDSLNELEQILGLKRAKYIKLDEEASYIQLKRY